MCVVNRRFLSGITLLVVLGPLAAVAWGQTPAAEKRALPALNIHWTDTPPVLDGKADDACWQQTEPTVEFLTLEHQGLKPCKPAVATEVRACYDAENLYLFWTAQESNMELLRVGGKEPKSPRARDDSIKYSKEDVAEFFFDPGQTRSDSFHLMINPAGCRYDSATAQAVNLSTYDYTPDWQVVPGRLPGAWTLELRIPFGELIVPGILRGTPRVGERWGINFGRKRVPVAVEFSCWGNGFGDPKTFGTAIFQGRKSGAQPAAVTVAGIGPLSYGPGAVDLTVTGAVGQVQASAELVKDGAKVSDIPTTAQDAAVSVPYRLLAIGDYKIRVKLASGGQTFYTAQAEALLRPNKWEALRGLDEKIKEGRAILTRTEKRHPIFTRLLEKLDAFDQASRPTLALLANAEQLSAEEWQALGRQASNLLTLWQPLRFDLNLARLYPGEQDSKQILFALGNATESDKVYREGLYTGSLTEPIQVSLAGNEWGSFQLEVLPFWQNLTNATVSFSDLKGPDGRALPADRYLWFRLNYVKVTKADPYDPTFFRYEPDPLMPAAPFTAPMGQVTGIWVDYKLPGDTPAGAYKGTVTVTANEQSVSRAVEIKSRGFEIPVKSSLETDWWFHPYTWRNFYGKQAVPYTPEILAKQAPVLERYRISSFPSDWNTLCPQVQFYREADGKFTFDWTTFDKYVKIALENNSTGFWSSLGTCDYNGWTVWCNRPECEFTDRATGQKRKLGDVYKPESWDFRANYDTYANNPLYCDFLKAYAQHLKDLGINDVSYFELYGEANGQKWLQMVVHHTFFRKLVPDLRLACYAFSPTIIDGEKSAIGLIDTWAPHATTLEDIGDTGEVVKDAIWTRRAKYGEKFWAYSCTESRDPDGNAAPYMIYDHPYQALRMHGWMAWKYKLDGYLLFMLSAVDQANVKAEPAQRWPNSDWEWSSGPWGGTMIYPGPDYPYQVIPGQRLANARKGLEDLEYFKALERAARKLDPKRHAALLASVKTALEVEPQIWTSLYVWTKDRSLLEAKRDQLAKLIVETEAAR